MFLFACFQHQDQMQLPSIVGMHTTADSHSPSVHRIFIRTSLAQYDTGLLGSNDSPALAL